jgi:hypothetical protein
MTPKVTYAGPWGKLICERNKKLKISCLTPVKEIEIRFGLSWADWRKVKNLRLAPFYRALNNFWEQMQTILKHIKLAQNVAVGLNFFYTYICRKYTSNHMPHLLALESPT